MSASYEPATMPGYPPKQGYPHQGYLQPNSNPAANSTSTLETKVADDTQRISRTPSPTPSEVKELSTGAIDWKTISKPRFWFRREWLWFYIGFFLILTITALVTIFHTQIVDKLTPVTRWLHDMKLGWLVPIGVLFVLSFPPLFGHEIVAILCGLVWGLWIGFGIVAAGTFIGEVGNFYAFKYCCRARGEKMEKTSMTYACLARVTRDGGFKVALIARLSAIPGHFTTAIFSTCGMNIFVFSLAAILSLPKQFITVYLGVILAQSESGVQDTKSRIVSDVVLAVTFIITLLACWYILTRMNRVKPQVIYDRRKARQNKLARNYSPYAHPASGTSTDVFNPNTSDSEIPLTANMHPQNQHWDQYGKAVGYAADPNLHTPKPRMANAAAFLPINRPRELEEGSNRPHAAAVGYTNLHGREDSTDTVGWDTEPSFTNPNNHLTHRTLSHPVPQASMTNPYSPEAHRNRFEAHPEMGQTPTQATFVSNESRHYARTGVASTGYAVEEPRSPFDDDDAYGGYILQDPQHFQGPTDSTFRTAYSSSPTGLTNPHADVSSSSPHITLENHHQAVHSPQPTSSSLR